MSKVILVYLILNAIVGICHPTKTIGELIAATGRVSKGVTYNIGLPVETEKHPHTNARHSVKIQKDGLEAAMFAAFAATNIHRAADAHEIYKPGDDDYPVKISCIVDLETEPFEFVTAKTNEPEKMKILNDRLHNGRPLSLYILGTGDSVNNFGNEMPATKFYSEHTPKWFKHVNRNICYIEYTFAKPPRDAMEFLKYVHRIIRVERHQHTAEVVRDLVHAVWLRYRYKPKKRLESWDDSGESEDRKEFKFTLAEVEIYGFSLGAIIGKYACNYLTVLAKKEEWPIEKVAKLTGLDTAGIPYYRSVDNIGAEDADFVEVIHTSSLGTIRKNGEFDTFVELVGDEETAASKHAFAAHLHMAVCTGEYIIIVSKKGPVRILPGDSKPNHLKPVLKDDEYELFSDHKPATSSKNKDHQFKLKCSAGDIGERL